MAKRSEQLAAVGAVLLLVTYFVLGVAGRAEDTPIPVSSARARALERTFPQRWAFFTKDPQSPALHLYRREPQGWTEVRLNNGLQLKNWLGFRRSRRILGRELGMVTSDLMPFEWFSCEGTIEACLEGTPATAEGAERIREVLGECGEYALVSVRPKPWSWRDLDNLQMPATFAKLKVSCP